MRQSEMSDKQLAVLAGQGDPEAYRRLFERFQNPVYNFVYRLVNNAEDASDIVQNAFLRMYTVLGEKEVENFSAYLYRTAKNLAYDEMRRRSKFADVDEELLAPEDPNIYADPQRALLLEEQMGTVRQAAEKLNENQRAALVLKELQDFNYDQLSEVLDSNRNAVGALLSRARLRFREELRMAHVQTDQMAPECEEIISLLSPYIDNELSDDEIGRVDTHLGDCTFCTAALEEMKEASRSFRMLIPIIPPADMAQAFTGRLADLSGQPFGDSGLVPDEAGQTPDDVGSPDDVGRGPDDTGADSALTQAGSQAGSRSAMSRIVRSKVLWVAVAGTVVFGTAALLLADDMGKDENISEPAIEVDMEPIELMSPVEGDPVMEPVEEIVEELPYEEYVPPAEEVPEEGPEPVPPDPVPPPNGGENPLPPPGDNQDPDNPDPVDPVPQDTPGLGTGSGPLDIDELPGIFWIPPSFAGPF